MPRVVIVVSDRQVTARRRRVAPLVPLVSAVQVARIGLLVPRRIAPVRGQGIMLAATACLLAAAAACAPSAGTNSDPSATAARAARQECQDVRARPGPIAAEAALGYASIEFRFNESGELRLCLKGLSHQTVTVAAPSGVEVTPSTTSSGSTNVVLRFTIRVQPQAHGALSIEIRSSTNHLSVSPAFGPTIESTQSGWRIVP